MKFKINFTVEFNIRVTAIKSTIKFFFHRIFIKLLWIPFNAQMLHRNNYVTFKKGIDFFSFCYKSFILLIQHFQVILQLLFLLPHRKAFTPATLCYFGVEFFFYYNSIFAMFFYYDTRTVRNKHFFSDFLGSMFYIFYIIYL